MDESTAKIALPSALPETDNGFQQLAADAAEVLLRLDDLPAPLAVRHDTVCPACLVRQRLSTTTADDVDDDLCDGVVG